MIIISRILVSALALLMVAYFIPGITLSSLYSAVIAAILLGLLNLIVRPILIVLTLPVTIVSLGIFMFVINAGIFLFVASFVDGFSVSGFWVAMLGSLLVSIVSSIGNKFIS